MKYSRLRMICAVLAMAVTLQVEPVYAGQVAPDGNEEVVLLGEQLQDSDTADANQEQQTDESGDNQETQPDTPDIPEEEKTALTPSPVRELRTTSRSKTKVLVAWKESDNAAFYDVYRKCGKKSYEKIASTDQTYYVDKKIQAGKSYYYQVVPLNSDNEAGEAGTILFANETVVRISTQKYTYDQMKRQMSALKKKYNDYCEMKVIGTSVNGKNIYDFAIGNPDAESSVLVVGTLHAREYICATVLMREIEFYLSNYNQSIDGIKPSEVLQTTQIHYIVMANPDGVAISQSKNARWKANARGVDLNRNFPARKFVVGGKKGAEGYSGKKALSEPESRAVASLTRHLQKEQNLQGVVNYHAMGQIIYGSCSAKGIYKDTKTMYRIAKQETGYKDAYESSGKSSGGQYREYVMYMLGIPSVTIEVGKTWAPCSYADYEREFQKNKYVVLKIAKVLG